MPNRRHVSRGEYRRKKRLLSTLRIEEKIHDIKKARRQIQAEPLSANEHALMRELAGLRRRAKFDALELELMNHERAYVGLPPLDHIPPDTADKRELIKMER